MTQGERQQGLLITLLQLFSWLTDKLIALLFPQVVINNKWPQDAYVDVYTDKKGRERKRAVRSWRWIRHPMSLEQVNYVDSMFWEYWLRWAIAWPIVMAAASKLSKGWASAIVIMWLLLAGWTFTGMLKARKIAVYERYEAHKDDKK